MAQNVYVCIPDKKGILPSTLQKILSVSARKKLVVNLSFSPENLKNAKNLNKSRNKRIGVFAHIDVSKTNAKTLFETVKKTIKAYPFVKGVFFESFGNKLTKTQFAHLRDFEVGLYKSLKFLSERKYDFVSSKIPLCFLGKFAFCSIEAQNIFLKRPEIRYSFPDNEFIKNKAFLDEYIKDDKCRFCNLDSICPGILSGSSSCGLDALSPLFIEENDIISEIKPLR
jgi:hypothetical protein